jgi:hypothetical protein
MTREWIDCDNCYGNGCIACGNRGRVESDEAREAREEHEDGAYDRWRDQRMDDGL